MEYAFVNVLKIFFIIISFTSWKTCTKRSEESKKGKYKNMRVRSKKERERDTTYYLYIKYLVIDFYTRRVLSIFLFQSVFLSLPSRLHVIIITHTTVYMHTLKNI